MRRYSQIPVKKSPEGKQMYRFDTLAQQYYNDSSLWWIISIANDNLNQNSLTPPVGSQVRIPSNPSPILAEFESINE
jgi:hypothetical protein